MSALRSLIACTLLLPIVACAGGTGPLPDGPHIRVQGHGEVEALPDLIIIDVAVSRTAPSSARAREQVDRVATEITATARRFEISGDDFDAAEIRVQPEYEWQDGERILRGQRVSRQFELTLRGREHYGELIQALSETDINAIQNIRFDFSNRVELFREAERRAAAAAREQAQNLAAAMEAELGTIYSIDTGSAAPAPEPRAEMMVAAKSRDQGSPVEVSRQSIRADISAVFLIKP